MATDVKDIVTGKRCWAHGPMAAIPSRMRRTSLYWFELKREGGKATVHPAHH